MKQIDRICFSNECHRKRRMHITMFICVIREYNRIGELEMKKINIRKRGGEEKRERESVHELI